MTAASVARSIDAAARRVEAERLPEVRDIQRVQSIPPYAVLSTSWWSRFALRLLPYLIGAGGRGPVLQRLAFGTTDVSLRV